MAYKALYRKFRPAVWEDVKGQDPVVTTLRNQIINDRVGHAYLFCGTRGTGKTTAAKIMAAAVNCEQPANGNPCGTCKSCVAAQKGTNVNIFEIDAASNNGVDNVREIVEEMAYSPVEGNKKVYIIDEAHMLSAGAFNALLKTLEEPPPYVLFILATTEVHKILPTILSRCQRYDFRRITSQVIGARLKEIAAEEKIAIDKQAIEYLARAADGALRDGLSLMDQCAAFYAGEKLTLDRVLEVLGAVDQTVYARFFDLLKEGDVAASIELIDEVVMQGRELTQFTNGFIWYLRNLMLAQNAEGIERVIDMSSEDLKTLKNQAVQTDRETLMRMIRLFSEVQAQMRGDMQKRLLLEMAVVRMARPSSEEGAASLEARVRALEEKENRVFAALKLIESGNYAAPEHEAFPSPKTAAPAPQQTQQGETSGNKAEPPVLSEGIRQVITHWDEYVPAMSGRLKAFMHAVPEPRLSVSQDGSSLVIAMFHEMHADSMERYGLTDEISDIIRARTGLEIKVMAEYAKDVESFRMKHTDLSDLIRMEIEEIEEDEEDE